MSDKQLQFGEDENLIALVNAWGKTLDIIKEQIPAPSYESWIKPTLPLSFENGVVKIGTTSKLAKGLIENHIKKIAPVLSDLLEQKITIKIELISKNMVPMVEQSGALPKKPEPIISKMDEQIAFPLNPRYNFDNFVVGQTNRLAHACAYSVANEPGKTYNPLFIYGGAGLGKTHLMQAVGHSIIQAGHALKVAYISGEHFTSSYVTAIQTHRTSEFRKKCRSVDVWLVDDVQFLVDKERIQEEFFHTFNSIYDTGKQIILTSDRSPKQLDMDKRLLSRFECGMLADIRPPDLETRMAILQDKAANENMTLSNEVVLYLARLITDNIRQLEGALIRLHAYASLTKTEVTPDFCHDLLGDYFGKQSQKIIDVGCVQKVVSEKFKIDMGDIQGKSRAKEIVIARQIAMYLSRELTEMSLSGIGSNFGGKDHTTIMHACKKIEGKLSEDTDFALLIEELMHVIKDGKTC